MLKSPHSRRHRAKVSRNKHRFKPRKLKKTTDRPSVVKTKEEKEEEWVVVEEDDEFDECMDKLESAP